MAWVMAAGMPRKTHYPGKKTRTHHDQHDHGVGLYGSHQAVEQDPWIHLAVEKGEDGGSQDTQRRRFGRCGNARVDAAQHHQNEDKRGGQIL